jgi:hypothetical protein
MTNKVEFEITLLKSGKTKKDVSNALGITLMGLYKKLNNQSEFKISELETITKLLNLNSEQQKRIFFAQKRDLKSTRKKAK